MTQFLDIEGHVTYALRNAAVRRWPFPHFFAENIFPDDVYRHFMTVLASKDDYVGGERNYNGRVFGTVGGLPELAFMETPSFLKTVASIFPHDFKARFTTPKIDLYTDLRLIRDSQNYHIGPHTDAAWKVVSLLFYMPADSWNMEHGTSIYLPKDESFRCPGGPHYPFEPFKRIYTAPYLPNTCFGFFKTDNSFHGVEPIDHGIRRDVLLYNIYDRQLQLQRSSPTPSHQEPS